MKNEIYNKDCFEVLKGIEDNSIDAVITDPPYGLLKGHKIETEIDIDLFFKEVKRVVKNKGFIVVFGAQPMLSKWISTALEHKLKFKQELIWYKRNRTNPFGVVGRAHENIVVFVKGSGRKFNEVRVRYSDLKESLEEYTEKGTVICRLHEAERILRDKKLLKECLEFDKDPKEFYNQKHVENDNIIFKKEFKRSKHIFRHSKVFLRGALLSSILSFKPHNLKQYGKDGYNIKHPTVKPIELIEQLIKLTTNENDIVLDPFMGSGTTGIACKLLDRNFIGVEIDKDYFEIAKKRIKETKDEEQTNLF